MAESQKSLPKSPYVLSKNPDLGLERRGLATWALEGCLYLRRVGQNLNRDSHNPFEIHIRFSFPLESIALRNRICVAGGT